MSNYPFDSSSVKSGPTGYRGVVHSLTLSLIQEAKDLPDAMERLELLDLPSRDRVAVTDWVKYCHGDSPAVEPKKVFATKSVSLSEAFIFHLSTMIVVLF